MTHNFIEKIDIIELNEKRDAIDLDGTYQNVIVKITTTSGHIGIGETDSRPNVIRSIIQGTGYNSASLSIENVLLGRDILDDNLYNDLEQALWWYGRNGVVRHALSAVDIAIWDCRGHILEKSVSKILGGNIQNQRLPAYKTLYPMPLDKDEFAATIHNAISSPLSGIKLCAEPWWLEYPDIAKFNLSLARKIVGKDFPLMLDCALAWTGKNNGIQFLETLRDNNYHWIEAPISLDYIKEHQLYQTYGTPVGVGDLGLTSPLEFTLYEPYSDFFQPDITLAGGFSGMMDIEKIGKPIVPHAHNTNITIGANLQFLARHPHTSWIEFSTSSSVLRHDTTNEDIIIEEDGYITVPTDAGLSLTLNTTTIEKYKQ